MKKSILTIIISITISGAIFPFGSYPSAQSPCDPKILDSADPSDTGYKWRSELSMCEGVYREPSSGEPNLEMVSLTQGPIRYNLEADRQLYVDIPGLNEIRKQPVRIQAVGREETTLYRMDAYMPPRGAFNWSLKTVLAREGIEDFMLGVYGWINNSDRRIFLPVAISTKREDCQIQAPIRLIVRTPLRVDCMAWRYAFENQALGKFEEIKHSNLGAGEWIPIEIPPGNKGILQIEVQGEPHNPDRKGNIWLPRILVFRP